METRTYKNWTIYLTDTGTGFSIGVIVDNTNGKLYEPFTFNPNEEFVVELREGECLHEGYSIDEVSREFFMYYIKRQIYLLKSKIKNERKIYEIYKNGPNKIPIYAGEGVEIFTFDCKYLKKRSAYLVHEGRTYEADEWINSLPSTPMEISVVGDRLILKFAKRSHSFSRIEEPHETIASEYLEKIKRGEGILANIRQMRDAIFPRDVVLS